MMAADRVPYAYHPGYHVPAEDRFDFSDWPDTIVLEDGEILHVIKEIADEPSPTPPDSQALPSSPSVIEVQDTPSVVEVPQQESLSLPGPGDAPRFTSTQKPPVGSEQPPSSADSLLLNIESVKQGLEKRPLPASKKKEALRSIERILELLRKEVRLQPASGLVQETDEELQLILSQELTVRTRKISLKRFNLFFLQGFIVGLSRARGIQRPRQGRPFALHVRVALRGWRHRPSWNEPSRDPVEGKVRKDAGAGARRPGEDGNSKKEDGEKENESLSDVVLIVKTRKLVL